MKITLKRSLMAVLCVVGMSSFVACGDDDDSIITPPVVEPTAENGSYTGTMSFEIPGAPAGSNVMSEPVTFDASQSTIGVDSVYFKKFPINGLINAILQENAGPVIEALKGGVKYAVYYTAKTSTSGMDITMTPKALTITVPMPAPAPALVVEIDVESAGAAKYVTATKTITFSLKAKNVKVGGAPFSGFQPLTLSFEATK